MQLTEDITKLALDSYDKGKKDFADSVIEALKNLIAKGYDVKMTIPEIIDLINSANENPH